MVKYKTRTTPCPGNGREPTLAWYTTYETRKRAEEVRAPSIMRLCACCRPRRISRYPAVRKYAETKFSVALRAGRSESSTAGLEPDAVDDERAEKQWQVGDREQEQPARRLARS